MTAAAYQPKPGETVLLTVRATVANDGMLVFARQPSSDIPGLIWPTDQAVVRIQPLPKPALPAAFGSRISAAIRGDRQELVLADPAADANQWMRQGGGWHDVSELSDVEVLYDAGGPQEAAEVGEPIPSYVPCDECESSGQNCRAHRNMPRRAELVNLPTGLGAVVLTRNGDDEEGYAVHLLSGRADPGTLSWRFFIPGFPHCTQWMTEEHVAARFMGSAEATPGDRP